MITKIDKIGEHINRRRIDFKYWVEQKLFRMVLI